MLEKITREQIATFLDVTPNGEHTFEKVGIGITSMGQEYNPQKTTEKWIIHKNATTSTDSYQIAAPVSQKCYKGDPVFEFVNNIRRNAKLGYACNSFVLDVDMWDADEDGAYAATLYECNIAITKYNDENAVIEYDIDYNGDPKVGKVTIENGKPTFVEDASI